MPLAKAQNSEISLEDLSPKPNPSGYTSYSPEEQKNLVAYIKQCKIDKKNLHSTREAYRDCQDKVGGKLLWWQTPVGVVSIGLGGLVLGLIVGGVSK